MKRILINIATVGPVGYSPVAPGTAGSLFAFLLCLLIKPSAELLIFFIVITFLVGIKASTEAETTLNEKDSSHIVIDEVSGYLVSVLFLPPTLLNLSLGFFIFRFFDILKPPPIRYFEQRLSGGFGVMFDDVLAGIYTSILLHLIVFLWG
ncbi:MAG: phosphatidylglycerophosphatase A [Nitrospirae bacterium]|nr:MAG: phosphatidylglycerophosphatase A [Nitrospirota bacterium]